MVGSRLLRGSIVCAATLLAAGCGHLVRLDSIAEIQRPEDVNDYRRADSANLVSEADIIEFSVVETVGGETCRSEIRSICKSHGCFYPDGKPLTAKSLRARTTAFILDSVGQISINFPTQSNKVCEHLPIPELKAGMLGRDWAEIKKDLERSWPRDQRSTLSVRRRPQAKAWLFPGDRVQITTQYKVAGGSGTEPQPYTFTHAVSSVGPDGLLYIPPLFNAGTEGEIGKWLEVGRAISRQAASARALVPVWQPGEKLGSQRTTDQIERCLSSRWRFDFDPSAASSAVEKDRCLRLGIDSESYGPDDDPNGLINYRLESKQSYMIVLSRGQRLERPFVSGLPVKAAVLDAIRQASGRDTLPDWAVWATVDPRAELGEGPFYARLDRPSALERVLVMPGDTIHISNYRPKQSRPR